jgi:D-serine deaminase-like pyridoxal phosphate-dependent protein
MDNNRWFEIENHQEVPSPSLLLYPHRITENIRRMVNIAGDASRLRPHIKTHKMSEILKIQDDFGITKCKCSTIAEAELAAMSGVRDILLAMQPVGPNLDRLFALIKAYPFSLFSVIADSAGIIKKLSDDATTNDAEITVFLDINNGMNRTGVSPSGEAFELYKLIYESPYLKPGGLHIYDGHINDYPPGERKESCDDAFYPVLELKQRLEDVNMPVPVMVAGGSPTFAIHAQRKEAIDLSPGTVVLWDYGYSKLFPDLNFLHAAMVITRVVSKPAGNLLCLDLGHKSIASEMPHPRVKLIGLDNFTVKKHSEEHLVIETSEAGKFKVGDCFYGIPWHICPTVSLYGSAVTVVDGKAAAEWNIEARNRRINY